MSEQVHASRRSAKDQLLMDLQAFIHASSDGVGFEDLRSTFVEVDPVLLLDALVQLEAGDVLRIKISHAAREKNMSIDTGRVISEATGVL